MRRIRLLLPVVLGMILLAQETAVRAEDWHIVTYDNKIRSGGVNTQELYYLLQDNSPINSGDRIIVDDDLDARWFNGVVNGYNYTAQNGVNNPIGINITQKELYFVVGSASGSITQNLRRYIAGTPQSRYPLFNVGWRPSYISTAAGSASRLIFEEPSAQRNTIFVLQNGRWSGNLGGTHVQTEDPLIRGYLGWTPTNFNVADARDGVSGGGAVRAVGSSSTNMDLKVGVTFETQMEFRGNEAEFGGALFAKNQNQSDITTEQQIISFQKGATFTGNRALVHDGGAIYATEGSYIKFHDAKTYEEFWNSGNGYARIEHLNFLVSDESYGGTFLGNTAAGSGGAIAASSNAIMVMHGGGDFSDNSANGLEWGNLRDSGTVSLDKTLDIDWDAEINNSNIKIYGMNGSGGAIFARDTAQITITGGATFLNNRAQRSGGAISVHLGAQVTISGPLLFTNNMASATTDPTYDALGGAIFLRGTGMSTSGTTRTATLTLDQISGKAGGRTADGEMLSNLMADPEDLNKQIPNFAFLYENSLLTMTPKAGNTFDIHDPIWSKTIERIDTWAAPANWSTHHNNRIVIGDPNSNAATGSVRIWGNSSDPELGMPNYLIFDPETGLRAFDPSDYHGNGYYGYLDVLYGKFELMDGAGTEAETKPGDPPIPTQFGSRLYYVWGTGTAYSGSIKIGNGPVATVTTQGTAGNPDMTSLSAQTPGRIVLHKFTGPLDAEGNTQYTTLRGDRIFMDNGTIQFSGTTPTGEASPNRLNDDTAKIETRLGYNLMANNQFEGRGHGGTFELDVYQEFNLYEAVNGTGGLTKSGRGLLIMSEETPQSNGNKTYVGLTVATGGTLRLIDSNIMAYRYDDLNTRPIIYPNNYDYRGRAVYDAYSRGVVLTDQTYDANEGGVTLLDLTQTTPVVPYGSDPESVVPKEQTLGALAGVASSEVRLNWDTDLVISYGWLPSSGNSIYYDSADPDNRFSETASEYLHEMFGADEFEGAENFNRYFEGSLIFNEAQDPEDLLKQHGRLIKRGKGFLGLAGQNTLLESTELQGGGLYVGHVEALGVYDETLSEKVGLLTVIGSENKEFGIRNDDDYTLQLRIKADASKFVEAEEEMDRRPAGALTINANSKTMTFDQVVSRYNGGAIEMEAGVGESNNGADLIFLGGGGYVFSRNRSEGKGGAIYAGGNLTLAGNTYFLDNGNHWGAIHVTGSNAPNLPNDVILSTTSGSIAFSQNGYSMTFEKNARIEVTGDFNVYFNDPIAITGENPATANVSYLQTGTGFVQFLGNSEFAGAVDVQNGEFRLADYALFGESNNFEVGRVYVGDRIGDTVNSVDVLFATEGLSQQEIIISVRNNITSLIGTSNEAVDVAETFATRTQLFLNQRLALNTSAQLDTPEKQIAQATEILDTMGISTAGMPKEDQTQWAINLLEEQLLAEISTALQAQLGNPNEIYTEGTLAGEGIVKAKAINIRGRISPDSHTYTIPLDENMQLLLNDQDLKAKFIPDDARCGTLTLESPEITLSGTYRVDLSYNAQEGNISDLIQANGVMTLKSSAALEIDTSTMNFANVYTKGHRFTIIRSNTELHGDLFQNISYINRLPRFLMMTAHGFSEAGNEYYLTFGKSGWTFLDPARTRNQKQIGGALNAMLGQIEGLDPVFTQLIYDTASMDTDAEVREVYEQLSTDLRANSMQMGMSEPWRQPFKRMPVREPGYRPQEVWRGQAYSRVPFRARPREIWYDALYRSTDTYGDGNAKTYGISRTGFMLGLEKEIHDDMRVGAVFGFSAPYLFQRNGKVDTNDFQGGFYTHMNMPLKSRLKMYVGMGGINYEYLRRERLSFADEACNNNYKGNFNGQSLAFSAELDRPFRWSDAVLLIPLIAFDHQLSHQDAFTEERVYYTVAERNYNQKFDKAEFSQSLVRIGFNGEFGTSDEFKLNTRVQYGVRLEDSAPTSRSRFAGLSASPSMLIEGIAFGSNFVNLGIGGHLYFDKVGKSKMFFDYNADITERSASNTVNVGFSHAF